MPLGYLWAVIGWNQMRSFSSLLAVALIVASTLPGHTEPAAANLANTIEISDPGIGSGLDVQVIVSELLQAVIDPTIVRKKPSNEYLQALGQLNDMQGSSSASPVRQ